MSQKKYGKYAVLFFLILLIFYSPLLAQKQEMGSENMREYIDELQKTAEDLKLHTKPYWHVLMHYKKGLTGYTSYVDDPKFFFAEDGKYNPENELKASIAAIFRRPAKGKRPVAEKFIARYYWLKEQLDIDPDLVPGSAEEKFKDFVSRFQTEHVYLVFPTGYINSPASMFGHTLIILEPKNGSRLAAVAVNYAARTNETFGPTFAFRGLFGLYKGYYSFMPYYEKIQEYSHQEMRDVWEYKLNLKPHEIERLLRHLIEMEDVYNWYYFLDENCAFNLMFLLDAARPESHVTQASGMSAEPVQTIRNVIHAGLVEDIIYRPSQYNRLLHLASFLSSEDQNLAMSIAAGKVDPEILLNNSYSDRKKLQISDFAIEDLKFISAKNQISQKQYKKIFIKLLTMRSGLKSEGNNNEHLKEAEPPVRPDHGHLLNKISAGYGQTCTEPFITVKYRPSYHELIDVEEGFNKNSEIVFGGIEGRYFYEDKKFYLERFDLLDIISLPESTKFSTEACWKFQTGYIRAISPDNERHSSFYMFSGGGFAGRLWLLGTFYCLAEADVFASKEFSDNLFLAPGARVGHLLDIASFWKSHISAKYSHNIMDDSTDVIDVEIAERFKLSRNLSLEFQYDYKNIFDDTNHEYKGMISLFF